MKKVMLKIEEYEYWFKNTDITYHLQEGFCINLEKVKCKGKYVKLYFDTCKTQKEVVYVLRDYFGVDTGHFLSMKQLRNC